MKRYTKTTLKLLALISLISISACDSNLAFNATRADSDKIPTISANLTQSQAGSIIRIPNLASIPEEIRISNDIKVAFDNSKTTIPVSKNSDGSFTFPASSSVRIDSQGNFNVLFLVDGQKSYLVTIKTGPVLKLKSPGILINPSTGTVIKGEKITLTANIDKQNKADFIFNWSYGSTSVGPFLPISGTSDIVDFTPQNVGNFYVKIEMIERSSGAISSYTSPVGIIFVTDANNIITASSSTLLRGKQTTLTANIPNTDPLKFDFTWSYGQSPQGPFLPISGTEKNINWTPNSSGSFYIKVEALNKETQEVSTYNTTEPVVFVTENEGIITTEPSLGNIVRGSSIKLSANVPTNQTSSYSWSFAPSVQGPWQSIPGSDKSIEWTPNQSGSFFVKTDVVDNQSNTISTFISPKAIVFVTEATNVLRTNPILANVKRGGFVTIFADIPGSQGKTLQYSWSSSSSGVPGTYQPLRNIKYELSKNSVRWRPDTEGSFYVKVDVVNVDNQSVSSFSSTTPIVFINEATPLFKTDPQTGKILQDSDIEITADLESTPNSTFAWSYGPSNQGPWFTIGGSNIPKIKWDKKNRAGGSDPRTGIFYPGQEGKPAGTYFVKVDLTDDSTDRSVSSFVSKSPIIFVERSESNFNNSSSFGSSTNPSGLSVAGN